MPAAWRTHAEEVECCRELYGEDGEKNDVDLHRHKTCSKGTHVSVVPGEAAMNMKQQLSAPLPALFQCQGLVLRGGGGLQSCKQPWAACPSSLASAFAEHALLLGAGRSRSWCPSMLLAFAYLVRSFSVLQENNKTSMCKWGCLDLVVKLKHRRENLAIVKLPFFFFFKNHSKIPKPSNIKT